MKSNPTVVELDITDKDKMTGAIENLKRELPNMIEMGKVMAEIRKANYDACIEQGFTPEQALELCKNITY